MPSASGGHGRPRSSWRRGHASPLDRSIYVPEDEICFFVFDAPSGRDAALAAQRAELDPLRVVEAISSREEELRSKRSRTTINDEGRGPT